MPDLLGLLGKKKAEAKDPWFYALSYSGPLARRNTELNAKREKILDQIFKRNVGVYGAINVRTDGKNVVIVFRNERPKGINRWFCYQFAMDNDGVFNSRILKVFRPAILLCRRKLKTESP